MKIDRLLEIVILLLGRESVTARELAEHFGVTVRTIQRDMTSIALAGIPLYANPGRSGGYSILPEYRLDGQLMKPEDCRWIARALDSLATSYSGYPLERLADRFNAMAARSGAPKTAGKGVNLCSISFLFWKVSSPSSPLACCPCCPFTFLISPAAGSGR